MVILNTIYRYVYKYIDDACINMNAYREKRVEEYLFCREREETLQERERGSTSKTELFLLSQSILYQSIAVSVRSNQSTISHILASFWALIWFEIFLYVAHLYKYLLSASKTSRTNNTPFFDFSP